MEGAKIVSRLTSESGVGVVMLTTRGGLENRLQGLDF